MNFGEATLRHHLRYFEEHMRDPAVTEIVVNEPGRYAVERGGEWSWHAEPGLTFNRLDGIGMLAAGMTNQTLSPYKPRAASILPGGLRIQVMRPPAVAPGKYSLTIRKRATDFTPTLEWLHARGCFSQLDPAVDWVRWWRKSVADKRAILLTGWTGSGKAQPLDSLVLTPTGFRRMGHIHIGDVLLAPDGKTTRVTGVFPQGEKDIYRVTFCDGRSVESCGDHLWKVWRHQPRYETGKSHATRRRLSDADWAVLPLSEIKAWFDKGKRQATRAAVPLVEPFSIEHPEQSLPIPPYALGALLGDGHLADIVSLSTADEFVLNRVLADLPDYEARKPPSSKYDYRLRQKDIAAHPTRRQMDVVSVVGGRRGRTRMVEHEGETLNMAEWSRRRGIGYHALQNRIRCYGWSPAQALGLSPPPSGRYTRSPIILKLQDMGLHGSRSYEKFIPEIYKRGSVSQRLALMQGLMDTDGTVGAGGCAAYYATASERLAKDVQQIAWSLGARARITIKRPSYTYKGTKKDGLPSYMVCVIHQDINQFFSLPRKLSACRPKAMRHRLAITKIEAVGKKLAQCISVDHPDQLYVTDNYVVTHNTTVAEGLIRAIPARERIITIEKTPEWFELVHPLWVALYYGSEGDGEASQRASVRCLEDSLRMRPDRICVGELRSPGEAWAYLRGMMAYAGGITTIHANDAAGGFDALALMLRQDVAGQTMDDADVRALLRKHIQIVAHCARDPYRITEVMEVA